jgi:nitrogen regulatory protein PII
MKKIEAVILPSRVGAIRAELERRGIFAGLTLTKVQHGDPHDHPTTVRNGSAGGLKKRIKLELIVGDRQAEKAVSVILRHALADSSEADGHVTLLDVHEVLQITHPTSDIRDPAARENS